MNIKQAKEKYLNFHNRYATDNIWHIKPKVSITDFTDTEKAYNIHIHYSVKEYFNAYYHDYITGSCMTNIGNKYDGIVLLPVLPSTNIKSVSASYGFIQLLQAWVNESGSTEYTPIGWSSYYGAEILVDNKTGKVKVCWNDYDDLLTFEADGLADLISKMAESLVVS